MAKAKAKTKSQPAKKSVRTVTARTVRARPVSARSQGAAMPRSMQNRGSGDSRKAVQQPRARGGASQKDRTAEQAVTRVTHETEVRGTETRIERVVERAPKPSLADV